jgi:hypothetical protein
MDTSRKRHPIETVLLLLFCGGVLAVGTAASAIPLRKISSAPRHAILGRYPARTVAHPDGVTSGNLLYHGGPVMHQTKSYAIYWVPAGWPIVAGYRSTINSYFTSASRDSGGTQNVYSTLTQYYDRSGPIAYSQTFGGSTTASDPFPRNGCPPYDGLTACVTDAQVLAEIRRVMTAKSWTGGPTHALFLFLPKGVGTCEDASGTSCAFSAFCAYHSWSGTGATEVLYANMPYADTEPQACGTGQRPNNSDADDTLNVTSHEHREMISDPNGNAWYDASGNEGSDKCAWRFGTPLGRTATGSYNQVISLHVYWLQEEWSNARPGCVQRGT